MQVKRSAEAPPLEHATPTLAPPPDISVKKSASSYEIKGDSDKMKGDGDTQSLVATSLLQ